MFAMNYHFYFLLERLKGNKKTHFLQVVAFKRRAIKCLRAVAQRFESLTVNDARIRAQQGVEGFRCEA